MKLFSDLVCAAGKMGSCRAAIEAMASVLAYIIDYINPGAITTFSAKTCTEQLQGLRRHKAYYLPCADTSGIRDNKMGSSQEHLTNCSSASFISSYRFQICSTPGSNNI